MNRNALIQAIVAESEGRFSNYTGPTANDLVGIQDQMHSNMGGAVASPMIDYSAAVQDIKFTIENSDEKNALAVPLFSASERLPLPFNGIKDIKTGNIAQAGKGITLTAQGLTENEVLDRVRTEPFVIAGLRYHYEDNQQLKQDWEIRYKEDRTTSTTPWTPYKNPSDSIDGLLEASSFVQKIDRGTTIFVVIAPAFGEGQPRQVQIIFKIGSSTKIGNVLEGKSAIVKHGQQFAQHQNVRVFA